MDQSDNMHGQPVNGKPSDHGHDDENLTFGEYVSRNLVSILIVFALLAYVFYAFDGDSRLAILKAAIGLSFVIFIHELGHFLAAKWCDVHVTTFSIGFGPPVPGCHFKRGETTYKLAMLPLGGYVQMVGQVDGDEASDGSEEDPRSYKNKTVAQRMLIISAGVIMNAILAVLCFIVVFMIPGKDRKAAVVGYVDTGKPAFRENIHTGASILQIGDVKNPYFENLMATVMATLHDQAITIVTKRPEDPKPFEEEIVPVLAKSEDGYDPRPVIGISTPATTVLASRRDLGKGAFDNPVNHYSPASRVKTPFQFGDVIVATTDPDDPSKIKELPIDPRRTDKKQTDYFEFTRRLQRLADQDVTIVVERGDKEKKRIEILVGPAFRHALGVRMRMGAVGVLRKGSPAEKAGINPKDFIEGVKVVEPDGQETVFEGKTLDPTRLPSQLRAWAVRMEKAKAPLPWKVTLNLVRHAKDALQEKVKESVVLDWDHSWAYDKAFATARSSPHAIPELGLAYFIKNEVWELSKDLPNNPFQPGDRILNLKFTFKGATGDEVPAYIPAKDKDLKEDEWAFVAWNLLGLAVTEVTKIEVTVERKKDGAKPERLTLEVTPTRDTTWPVSDQDRGLILMADFRLQKADDFLEAIGLGFQDTWQNMKQVFQNIRGMVVGRVSPKNLGGPITIANVAYRIAGRDIWEFIFFMGMISINLAVINFLPIPVLDGGHMVFLLYEKLRGKPASESVRVGATYLGLALVLSLMIFVIYLDVTRNF